MVDLGRVQKELQECNRDVQVSGIKVSPRGDSLTNLSGTIPGPLGTPYEGGSFKIDITLPGICFLILYPFFFFFFFLIIEIIQSEENTVSFVIVVWHVGLGFMILKLYVHINMCFHFPCLAVKIIQLGTWLSTWW